LWFIAAFDHVVLAAALHAVVVGAGAYLVFWIFRRRGWPMVGNVAAVVLFLAYLYAYFAVGIPMVA